MRRSSRATTLARFYNVDSTIDETITISNGTFDVVEIQLCPLADPWHAAYAPGDRFWKISIDGGATYSQPIPLYGKSAYEEWLDLGNEGTPQEFLNSLKGQDGAAGTALPITRQRFAVLTLTIQHTWLFRQLRHWIFPTPKRSSTQKM